MKTTTILSALVATSLLAAGCENLPGDERQQGAAGGAAGGALAGAALSEDNRALGALVGGLLGAGGGYLVGTEVQKNRDEARRASEQARDNPATVDDVERSRTADLDGNGFVTLDELEALKESGLGDDEIVRRAEATNQVFEFNAGARNQLRDAGYSNRTLDRIEAVNRERAAREMGERVSQPRR